MLRRGKDRLLSAYEGVLYSSHKDILGFISSLIANSSSNGVKASISKILLRTIHHVTTLIIFANPLLNMQIYLIHQLSAALGYWNALVVKGFVIWNQ